MKKLFNDEFVASNMNALVNLKIGDEVITENQIKAVREILEIESDTFDEVQAKRNSVVKLFSDEKRKYRNDEIFDAKNFVKYNNTMSGVVVVLDARLWALMNKVNA